MGPKRQRDGTWVNLPIGEAMAMVGIDDIGLYIDHCQKAVAQYIATHPIMEFCLASNRNPGMRLSMRWWEKPALDILGIIAGRATLEGVGGERNWKERERDIRVGNDEGR